MKKHFRDIVIRKDVEVALPRHDSSAAGRGIFLSKHCQVFDGLGIIDQSVDWLPNFDHASFCHFAACWLSISRLEVTLSSDEPFRTNELLHLPGLSHDGAG
jgi:hypothetical protein